MDLPPTKPPDPPPSLPENNTIDGENTSPTTSTTEIRHIAADLGQNKSVLHWESQGTHPNALNSTSYDQNLDMGPSPMISEAPKTPRMVSPTSNLTGINTLENVQQISIRKHVGPTNVHVPDPQIGHSGGSRFGVLADPTLDIVQCSTVVSSTTLVSTISQTQQTVGPNSRHVRPTIDFSHSIHTGPTLEAPLPAGSSHLSTAPSYISSLLPTPILSVSQSLDVSRPAIDYCGPYRQPPLAVGHYAESRSVIDLVYGSSLHDRPTISVGPTTTLAHSELEKTGD
ncbi:hypothetical protein Fot_06220 [Forsythia ovata]|uniref:Uncharacterized protein n=1 Tax=Forsythia ovata TaxID=205694 RepID=A0ABD1WSC3_9LAMI